MIRWGIPAVRRRISHQAIGSLIRTSSQPATRTTSCTLATLPKPKRSEASLSPSPAQGMHTCIRMHTICHLSALPTSNQSVALISINHMSDSIERYLTACTPGESDMSTVPLCLPKPPIPTRPPPLTSHAAAACHQAKPSPMQPAAIRLLPSHPPAIPLYSRHSCHSSHSSRRRCTSTRTSCR